MQSALNAHIFGVSLADKFLFPIHGETWPQRLVILVFVAISASTTFMTMRQSSRRGMMQQGPVDPDNPAANMQKYMMYIAPFFALTGLYWQFGLVIYWVTTNIWTLGQQHILFRNLPVVGSATVGASAVQAASGNTGVTGKSNTGKISSSVKAAITGKTDEPQDSVPKAGTAKTSGVPKTSAARTTGTKTSAANASAPKAGAPKPSAPKASANGSSAPSAPVSPSTGGARGLLRLGRTKPEPEAVPAAPQTKTVRQQPTRQTRSKRSGKR